MGEIGLAVTRGRARALAGKLPRPPIIVAGAAVPAARTAAGRIAGAGRGAAAHRHDAPSGVPVAPALIARRPWPASPSSVKVVALLGRAEAGVHPLLPPGARCPLVTDPQSQESYLGYTRTRGRSRAPAHDSWRGSCFYGSSRTSSGSWRPRPRIAICCRGRSGGTRGHLTRRGGSSTRWRTRSTRYGGRSSCGTARNTSTSSRGARRPRAGYYGWEYSRSTTAYAWSTSSSGGTG